ncbi:MAG: hypothetical protein M1156_01165, partial [Candidatus Marsarchaeota archaeon]|nr:hypothetical protein [Candidatus Marsarchaeota archaeon]
MPKGNNYKINLWKSISLENFEFVAEKRFNSVQERFFLRGADLGRMQNLHRDRQGPDSILHLENNEFSILLRDMAAGSAASGKERGIKGRGDLTAEELEEYNKTCFNTHLDYQLNVFWDSFEVLKDAIPRYVRMIYFNMDLLEKLVNELNSEGMNPGLGERYG